MEAPKQTFFTTKWFIDYVGRTEDRGWGGGLGEQREMTEGDKQLSDARRETQAGDAVAPLLSRPAIPTSSSRCRQYHTSAQSPVPKFDGKSISKLFQGTSAQSVLTAPPDPASTTSFRLFTFPSQIRVSRTRSPSRRVLYPRAKMEDSPPLGPRLLAFHGQ